MGIHVIGVDVFGVDVMALIHLDKGTRVILMVTIEIAYESVVLTKETGVIRGLLTDGDRWKAEKI